MDEILDESEMIVVCPNCKVELRGQFCAACGQNQKGSNRFFLSLVAEAVEDIFTFDSRASKTIVRLIFKPGKLTNEYFKGKRARYVQPLRLYFITSLAFFFFMSIQNIVSSPELIIESGDSPDQKIGELQTGELQTAEQQASNKINQALKEAKEQKEKENLDAELDEFKSELNLSFLPEELEHKLEKQFESQIKKVIEVGKDNPKEILNKLLDLAPPVIFCLLPIFALLLKIAYINTGRYYTEHLILAVHNHCFIYLTLLLLGLLSLVTENVFTNFLNFIILIWIPIYLFLSLKNTYDEGWFLTTIKYTLLGIAYTLLFSFISLIAVVIGILTL
ncbi:MAG: vacuolar-type H+-ATPase subunit H [Candidatus Azotimanducaceae bacterium]